MSRQIRDILAGRLSGMSHKELSEGRPRRLGLDVPEAEGMTKAQRVDAALEGMTELELADLARRLATELEDIGLDEAALAVLERDTPPITEITRRDLARVFGDDLSGDRALLPLVQTWFQLPVGLESLFGGRSRTLSLRDQIERYMVENPGDWSVETLFDKIGALTCSRARFTAFLEDVLRPLGWRGDAQVKLVAALGPILARDGYELVVQGEESGYPVYAIQPIVRGVAGRPKNLIFASRGPKPELGFADAVNNDIVILSGQTSCLVYDRPIGAAGLAWTELVDWWAGHSDGSAQDTAAHLGRRLQESLGSDGERNLFATYFRQFRPRLGDALPALIPQVYLHWDPAIVKTLRHRLPLPRQRMDFLMLLPNRQRVVIEVDGSQHFAEDGKPSLRLYAEMMSADRELRLAGYELYRFGSNEVVGAGSEDRIADFFDKLLKRHKVG